MDELARNATLELESMVAELTGETKDGEIEPAKDARWIRRFSATGKQTETAPPIRMS